MRRIMLASATVILGTPIALAQPTPTFTYATADDVAAAEKAEKPKWEAGAQAGLILTTGNSRVTTFATGLTASRKAKKYKLSLEAGAAYAKSSIFLGVDDDGSGTLSADEIDRPSQVTTRSWLIKGRYDHYLTKKNALFLAAGVSADKPAGKELVGNAQAGYSRELYQHDVHTFTGEIGYDFSYEDQVIGDPFAIHSVRGFGAYKGALSDDTSVDLSVEALFNVNDLDTATGPVDAFDDQRYTGKLALSTKLSTKLAFRFSFETKFDNAPAPRAPFAIPFEAGFVPVADKLDTKAEATLIVSLL